MGRKPCCSKEGLNRGAWTAMEDKLLTDYIKIHGEGQWRNLPKNAGLKRCGKSCRLRWINYLRPDIKRGNITADEEELIIRLHKLLGNRWSLIAGRLPGRTDNEIKNYWNTNICKKLQSAAEEQSGNRKPSNQSKKKAKPAIKTSLIKQPSKANSSSSCVIRTKATRCKKVFIDWPPRPAEQQLDQDSSSKPSLPPPVAAEPESSEHVPKEVKLVDDPMNFMVDLEFDGNFLSEFLNSNDTSEQGQYSSANSDDDISLLFTDDKMMQDLDFTSMASLLEFEQDWLQDHQVD